MSQKKVTEILKKISLGGPRYQGVAKSQKVLRWLDRGSRDVLNGEKILALQRT